MSDFGDADPEDAYDVDDPPAAKIAVLLRMLLSVSQEAAQPHDHIRAVIRLAFALKVVNELRAQNDPQFVALLLALWVGFSILQSDEGP